MPKIKKHMTKDEPLLKSVVRSKPSSKKMEIFTEKEMTREKIDRLKDWVTFYRNNPSYFAEHYLQIPLHPYQRYWLNLMAKSTDFLAIASRASAKSWIIAVYAMIRCILYPGTTVALCSSTKGQAGLIISQHCQKLYDSHPNLANEVVKITSNLNKWQVDFYNGSMINVVISAEGGRGHRSNVTVLEERRLIPEGVIDSIIRPFLVSRQPPYLKNPKYSDLQEEPQEIIITSAYYKSHPWWEEAKETLRRIANGDSDTRAVFFDYLISLKHNIKTKKQMAKEKLKLDFISFGQEYENIPYGSSALSFYKLGLFNRVVKRSWRPIKDETYITTKKNIYDIPRTSDEYRIMSIDVAMRAGSTNDNTIITCARLLPSLKGWLTEICYIESHNGQHTTTQTLKIKQIFEEFNADVIVLDIANAGISLMDSLSSVTKDEVRGVEYEAYTVIENDKGWVDKDLWTELSERTLAKDARPCIFPVYGNAPLNSAMAVSLRDRLKRKLLTFLVDDNVEEEFLIKSENKDILDPNDSELRAYLLQAHLQTSLMINESISLDMKMINGLIKLEEPSGGRKDRYTSLVYLNYYVSLMDIELLKDRKENNIDKDFLSLFQTA